MIQASGDSTSGHHALVPVREGEVLVATPGERQHEGRTGIYDVRVTSGDRVVAEFRGHCRTTGARMDLGHAR